MRYRSRYRDCYNTDCCQYKTTICDLQSLRACDYEYNYNPSLHYTYLQAMQQTQIRTGRPFTINLHPIVHVQDLLDDVVAVLEGDVLHQVHPPAAVQKDSGQLCSAPTNLQSLMVETWSSRPLYSTLYTHRFHAARPKS